MKKLIYSVFTLLALSLIIAGCSGDSYEKRLKTEKRAINNYIADNGIKVRNDYPSDHVFADNEYYLEGSTGVYLKVVKPGKLDDVLTDEDMGLDVMVRFDSVYYLVSETAELGNNYSFMKFSYGVTNEYLRNDYNQYPIEYRFMSPACVLPLEKGVGNGAVVDLIIPFLNGSAYQRNYYEPIKFVRMTYSYHKQEVKK